MAITLLQLHDEVYRVIGEQADARMDATRIVNDAGRYLFALHGWGWKRRPPADLDFVADQSYVALPSDFHFGEIIDLSPDNILSYSVRQVSLSEVERYRSANLEWHLGYYVALAYPDQASTSTAPGIARLEIEPTPQTSQSGALRLTYRAGWKPLSANADVANVPPPIEPLLVELVRGFAIRDLKHDRSYLDGIEDSPLLMRLMQADGRAQSNLGQMRGGMTQTPQTGHRIVSVWSTE